MDRSRHRTTPVVQCSPMQQGQYSRSIDPALQRLPLAAKFAHEIVGRCCRKRQENRKPQLTCPNVKCAQIAQDLVQIVSVDQIEHGVEQP
jgi:hypothetical protein